MELEPKTARSFCKVAEEFATKLLNEGIDKWMPMGGCVIGKIFDWLITNSTE